MEERNPQTRLSAERTQLAWWRTGLTAIAVGIEIGRILPALDPSVDKLPYVLLRVRLRRLRDCADRNRERPSRAPRSGRRGGWLRSLSPRGGGLLGAVGALLGGGVVAVVAGSGDRLHPVWPPLPGGVLEGGVSRSFWSAYSAANLAIARSKLSPPPR